MRNRTIVLCIALFLLIFSRACAESFKGKCVGVKDGDSITVLNGKSPVEIRLEGIDCPEKGQPFGKNAKKFTSSLVFGKIVTVKPETIDRYGRTVARVYVNGRDLSLELVRAGLAWHYKHYSSDPVLAKAEEAARGKKLGLWAMPSPEPPWDYRHRGDKHGAKE
jgi:micrococcal nuclease